MTQHETKEHYEKLGYKVIVVTEYNPDLYKQQFDDIPLHSLGVFIKEDIVVPFKKMSKDYKEFVPQAVEALKRGLKLFGAVQEPLVKVTDTPDPPGESCTSPVSSPEDNYAR